MLVKRSEHNDLSAVVADFGLAAKIPMSTDHRLPQVGSPYWMSPECLKGKFYDQIADLFSFGEYGDCTFWLLHENGKHISTKKVCTLSF